MKIQRWKEYFKWDQNYKSDMTDHKNIVKHILNKILQMNSEDNLGHIYKSDGR